jgi:hypothetical protein
MFLGKKCHVVENPLSEQYALMESLTKYHFNGYYMDVYDEIRNWIRIGVPAAAAAALLLLLGIRISRR